MSRLFALIAVLVLATGCAGPDYGASTIKSKPSVSGCPEPNSPCAPGGDGL